MTRSLTPLGASVLLLAAALAPGAAQDAPAARVDTVARRLEARALRHTSVEEFGQSVVRQVLLEVARKPAAQRTGTMVVNVPVAVRLFRVPGPNEIDVCFETSTGVQSYVDCTSPVEIAEPRPLPTRCDELSAQFAAATTNGARWAILRQMIIAGCLELRPGRIAIVPN